MMAKNLALILLMLAIVGGVAGQCTDQNCNNCTDTTCNGCTSSYVVVNNSCVCQGPNTVFNGSCYLCNIDNCNLCQVDNQCNTCNNPFVVNNQNNSQCICPTNQVQNGAQCNCPAPFVLNNNNC